MSNNDPSLWGAGITQVPIPGPPGPAGPPPTLRVGSVTSGPAKVTVTEVSPGEYVLNYVIPQGPTGPRGLPGEPARFSNVSTVTLPAGASASASISGIGPNYNLEFRIPRGATGATGAKGDPGVASRILSGTNAPAPQVGRDGDYYVKTSSPLTFYGPKFNGAWPNTGVPIQGEPGAPAVNPNFIIGTVQPGPSPDVSLSGIYPNLTLDFTLVKGDKGDPGQVQEVKAGTNISIDNTDPAEPIVNFTGTLGGKVDSIVGGTGITIDNTDPENPIVNYTGSGGGGADPDTPILLWQGV